MWHDYRVSKPKLFNISKLSFVETKIVKLNEETWGASFEPGKWYWT